jgi:uncharacterized protein YqeY
MAPTDQMTTGNDPDTMYPAATGRWDMTVQAEKVRAMLRRDLVSALKAGDPFATAAIRSLLTAIDNAEAPPADSHQQNGNHSEHFAGSVAGLGGAEVERQHLADADLRAIIEGEIRERSVAATEYEQIDRDEQARRLRLEAEVLRRYL